MSISTLLTFLAGSLESLAPLLLPSKAFPALDLQEPAAEPARALSWLAAALTCSFNTLTLRLAFEYKINDRDTFIET